MKFQTNNNETIFVSEIVPERSYMYDHDLKTGLSILWNTGAPAHFKIDDRDVTIGTDCMIFLTEFFQIEDIQFERMNVIQFNRNFYCVQNNDELGCRGLLFYGGSEVPKITVLRDQLPFFRSVWTNLMEEIDTNMEFKLEMLKSLLHRFLILAVRAYKEELNFIPTDNANIGLIREFNYLVEQHYLMHTTVKEYARILNKSPKTLSNLFHKYIDRTPLQLINDRRILEAKRKLKYTDSTIQEIAYHLNSTDVPAFSHFFKKHEGLSPTQFRNVKTA